MEAEALQNAPTVTGWLCMQSNINILGSEQGLANWWRPLRLKNRTERKRPHKHKQFCLVIAWMGKGGGFFRPGVQGSNVYVLCAEAKKNKHFRLGTLSGGSVTGVTEKLFMCQILCALSGPLLKKPLRALLRNVLLHDPVGVHPIEDHISLVLSQQCAC